MIFAVSLRSEIGVYLRNDANEFMNAAKNLLYRHIFSLDNAAPFLPDNFRTPGYTLFLSAIYLVFLSFRPAIFIGAAVFAFSAPLTYLIGKEIFHEKIAFVSALIFAIEPWALFQSGFLIAEQIFMPTFLFSVYLFCRYLKTETAQFIYWAVLVLSVTTLIRPLSAFLILIFLFFVFIREAKISMRRASLISFLSILIFISVLSPWLIRNKIVLNTWQISSISNVSLYVENYMMLEKYLGKMEKSEDINERARILLGTKNYEEAKKTENAKILGKTAFEEIKSNLGSYIAMHLGKLPLFLLRNSYGNIFFDLKIPGANIQSDIGRDLSNKDFASLFVLIKSVSISSKILIALAFFWPLIVVLAMVGIFAKFKTDPKNLIFWFLILWIGYFLALTGNLRDISRYKLAINAPLFIFAVFGLYRIYNFLKIYGN